MTYQELYSFLKYNSRNISYRRVYVQIDESSELFEITEIFQEKSIDGGGIWIRATTKNPNSIIKKDTK